jgi:hypothetical protein
VELRLPCRKLRVFLDFRADLDHLRREQVMMVAHRVRPSNSVQFTPKWPSQFTGRDGRCLLFLNTNWTGMRRDIYRSMPWRLNSRTVTPMKRLK